MTTIENFRSENLFLLVGGNPLPNAVAGKLLVAPTGTVTLLHSENTFDIALPLSRWLYSQGIKNVRLKQVHEFHPDAIIRGVQEELAAVGASSVGLSYTGGTKAMSVHAYRAIEQWAQSKGISPIFSYLDARTLRMVFNPPDPVSGEKGEEIYIGRAVEMKLADLVGLHGWILMREPNHTPAMPAAAKILIGLRDDWRDWVKNVLEKNCYSGRDRWKKDSELQNVQLDFSTYPSLMPVVTSLNTELRQTGDSISLGVAARVLRKPPHYICDWLHGKWLEHYVIKLLNDLASNLHLHELAQNVEIDLIQFEMDVVAMRGYQLFAFSCSTSRERGFLKHKLFEAFIRARQLGGDEAHVALICFSDEPDELEVQMQRDLDAEGRIRVFGSGHLADLSTHLEHWIQDQSKEE